MNINVTKQEFINLYLDTDISFAELEKILGISRFKINKLAEQQGLGKRCRKRIRRH